MSQAVDSTISHLEDVLPVLQATPAALRSLLEHLPDSWLDFHEDPDAWSPRTVLVHFIQNERTNWIPRAKVALSSAADRAFAPFQQLPAAGEIDALDVGALLEEFAVRRGQNLQMLKDFQLRREDYLRTAEHPALGTVTLGQLLATWVVHDLNHTHQIVKSLARRHVEAVGPWRQYLGILDL